MTDQKTEENIMQFLAHTDPTSHQFALIVGMTLGVILGYAWARIVRRA